jgi:hypothetical protein
MEVVKCKTEGCGKMVAPTAKVCPNCGVEYPASYIPSKVIFHRSDSLFGFAVGMKIIVGGKEVGKLDRDETLTISLTRGDYLIEVKGPFWGTHSGETSIAILPAKIYRIELSLSPGFPENHVNFQSYVSDT